MPEVRCTCSVTQTHSQVGDGAGSSSLGPLLSTGTPVLLRDPPGDRHLTFLPVQSCDSGVIREVAEKAEITFPFHLRWVADPAWLPAASLVRKAVY